MQIDLSTIDAIDKNNVSLMGRSQTPGMVVGLVQDGKPVFIKGYGVSNINTSMDVNADTVFRIASISKILTAVGVIQLVERKKIDLDGPVDSYLRSFRIRKHDLADPPITIRHLLTHMAGIGELAPLLGYIQPQTFMGVSLKNRSLPSLSKLYRGELRPDRSPGMAWSYANHGYATLGQVIADVSGLSFPKYMQQNIFEPLDMHCSDFVRSEKVTHALATGYWQFMGKFRPVLDVDIITLADGSLFTNASDFAKFLGAISTNGGDIISNQSLGMMMRPQYQLDKHLPAMGLGFQLESRTLWGGNLVASHTGLWLGFHSSMMMAPKHQVGAFAFGNDGRTIALSAASASLRRTLDNDIPSKTPPQVKPRPELWPKLSGIYEPLAGLNSNLRLWLVYRARFKVKEHEGKLMLYSRSGPWQKGVTLRPIDPDNPLVFRAGQQTIVFKRNAQGEIDRFAMRFTELFKQ
ncbi:MAG: serine hydrolase domain-containing protein [Chloroflexota bacterium]